MTDRRLCIPTLRGVYLGVVLITLCFTSICICQQRLCEVHTNLLERCSDTTHYDMHFEKKTSGLVVHVSRFSKHDFLLSSRKCTVPEPMDHSAATSLSEARKAPYSLYLVFKISVLWCNLPKNILDIELRADLRPHLHTTEKHRGKRLQISFTARTSTKDRLNTFYIPVLPHWTIQKAAIIIFQLTAETTYSFYAALHQVPAITDAERDRSPNLLDSYFLALGQPGASEDPKSVLQDLLDPNTLDTGSVELITDAAGKRHFQFGTLGEDITTQMTFTREHFPPTLSPTFTFALDAQLVIPQGSVESFGCEICIVLLDRLHNELTLPNNHCIYISRFHIEEHRKKHSPDADGNHLYPVLITAPWADKILKLHRIEILIKCRISTTLSSYRIRPISATIINKSPLSCDSPYTSQASNTMESPSYPDPSSNSPKAREHGISTTSSPDTTPGEVSPAGGETVPTPGPHDTRDPTVSPVQPRSRGMGSLRAVVGALGAGRRSTSVVAAAVVRRGMPRPGRAGAWGTGRAALLVLGVVCGVVLLLAAVVLVLALRRCLRRSRAASSHFYSSMDCNSQQCPSTDFCLTDVS